MPKPFEIELGIRLGVRSLFVKGLQSPRIFCDPLGFRDTKLEQAGERGGETSLFSSVTSNIVQRQDELFEKHFL